MISYIALVIHLLTLNKQMPGGIDENWEHEKIEQPLNWIKYQIRYIHNIVNKIVNNIELDTL